MARYYPGLNEARARLAVAPLKVLLDTLDSLFGRDNLKYGDGIEDVRREAMRQIECEFTIPSERV